MRSLEDKEGDNWSVKAFLALTHMMIVLHQETSFDARKENLERCVLLAQQVVAHCEIESTKVLAQSVLDWHESLVAKAGPLG